MNNGFPIPLLGRHPTLASRFLAACGSLVCASLIAGAITQAVRMEFLHGSSLGVSLLLCVFGAGFFVLPVWFFAYLPLFLFLDSHSFLWRWYISVPVGAFLGLLCFLHVFDGSLRDFVTPPIPGLLPGYVPTIASSAVFLVGSLFNAYDRAILTPKPDEARQGAL